MKFIVAIAVGVATGVAAVFLHHFAPPFGSAIAIVSNANSPCYVNANSTALKAEITGQGNIYYTGAPNSLITHLNGAGKVLPY